MLHRILGFYILTLFTLLFISTSCVSAYLTDVHPTINAKGISVAESWMDNDPILRYSSLNENHQILGDAGDNHKVVSNNPSDTKSMKEWIIFGGKAADIPSIQFRFHFYNPDTDEGFFGWLPGKVGDTAPNYAVVESNSYSWPNAQKYFIEAAKSEKPYNAYYGFAWRSVGETMHLAEDMLCPPHIWNDPHTVWDPYEDTTTNGVINSIPVESVSYTHLRRRRCAANDRSARSTC